MKIVTIVAVDTQMVIGAGNKIPWHAPADLAFFKQKTLHQHILMGYQTYASLPRLLPQRQHIVLTRQNLANLPQPTAELCFCNGYEAALDICAQRQAAELWIIGGGQIYAQLLPFSEELYISRIDTKTENPDTFFPAIPANFLLTAENKRAADEKNLYDINFQLYVNQAVIR